MKTNIVSLVLLSFLCTSIADAQPFERAPKTPRKVKQIVEWLMTDLEGKATKGSTSYFDEKGNLISYYHEDDSIEDRIVRRYDSKNRVVESKDGSGIESRTSTYTYQKDQITELTTYKTSAYKKIQYFNPKKQPLEEKTYVKGEGIGEQWVLKDRIVYTYNAKDSLKGEMYYSHLNLYGGKGTNKRKTLHFYDPTTKLKSKTIYYDFDHSVRIRTNYEYTKDRKISKITHHHMLDDTIHSKEFLYNKDGSIWQIISDSSEKKNVQIFQEGKLIRLRSYMSGNIFLVIDYQYNYY